jgi:hypothetical protein
MNERRLILKAGRALTNEWQSNLDGAMALYKEQERICKELGNKNGLSISLCNQAILLSGWYFNPGETAPL